MKNSLSNRSFYNESEGDEDDEKAFTGENQYDGDEEKAFTGENRYDGNDSDSSYYSVDNDQKNKPDSFNTSWPQSYRQSLDLYSSLASPNLGFFGSSPFLSSTLRRKQTSESLEATSKPLLSSFPDESAFDQRHCSLSLLPPLPTRKSSIKKDEKSTHISHELPISRNCSFGQAVVNGVNVLCGVALLSTPYAAKLGGWAGLSVLLIFGIISFYTGLLLRRCLDSGPGLQTYPDIGQAAFGTTGRIIVSALCVECIILESDNLSALFPNAHLSLAVFKLDSQHFFALVATLGFLPTVWLRDLSVLSYLSAGGVLMSTLVVACLFWAGQVDHIGFHHSGKVLNLSNLPVAIGMYGFCFSGHAVFPNIYTSMANRAQFPLVLLTCFGICTLLYGGVAIMGYTMFGESTESQFTLNMPQHLISSKIAVYTTVFSPFTRYPFMCLVMYSCANFYASVQLTVVKKNICSESCLNTFALTLSPVALSLEELIPSNHRESHIYAICIRTVLVISTLVVGLCIPFFVNFLVIIVAGRWSPVVVNSWWCVFWSGVVVDRFVTHNANSKFSFSNLAMSLTMLHARIFANHVTFILPCACYLSILNRKVTLLQVMLCILIIGIGVVSSISGTYSAVSKIIENLND
ncbi:hypothetical protein ACFE04_009875 [Oxalis oulophora]